MSDIKETIVTLQIDLKVEGGQFLYVNTEMLKEVDKFLTAIHNSSLTAEIYNFAIRTNVLRTLPSELAPYDDDDYDNGEPGDYEDDD